MYCLLSSVFKNLRAFMWWPYFAERGRRNTVCTTAQVLCTKIREQTTKQMLLCKVATIEPWTVISTTMTTTDTWMACFYKPQPPRDFRAAQSLGVKIKHPPYQTAFKDAWLVRNREKEFQEIHYTLVQNSHRKIIVFFTKCLALKSQIF